MRTFVHGEWLKERALLYGDPLPTGSLYVALSISPFSDTDLMATTVAGVTSLHEGTWAGYGRQLLSVTTTKDSGLRIWLDRAANVHFGVLGAAETCHFALIYLGTTASPSGDATALPRAIIDNTTGGPTVFPFTPDGIKPVNLRFSPSGLITGPNCAVVSARALTMEDSLFFAENFR